MTGRWNEIMDRLREINPGYAAEGERIAAHYAERSSCCHGQPDLCRREWLARIVDDPQGTVPYAGGDMEAIEIELHTNNWLHMARAALRERGS